MTEEENTRIVREIYAAYRERNHTAIVNSFSDVFELHMPGSPDEIPWARTCRTRQEVAQMLDDLSGATEMSPLHVHNFIAKGDQVVALGSSSMRVKNTGHEFTEHWAMVWTLREGKVTAMRTYYDTRKTAEALAG